MTTLLRRGSLGSLEWRQDDHPWFDAQLSDAAVSDLSERVRLLVARALRETQREERRAARQELERATRR